MLCVIEYDCTSEFMRDVGSKTFGTYDEFKEAFTSFDLKTTALGSRLCVHNRVGSC